MSNVTVKAQPDEGELNPPAGRQEYQGRWARPLVFSGESSAGGSWRVVWRGPLADELELFDPARRVFLRAHGGVVDLLIKKAIVAVAHKMIRLIFVLLTRKQAFLETTTAA